MNGDPAHYDDGTGKALCGTISRVRKVGAIADVTCGRCRSLAAKPGSIHIDVHPDVRAVIAAALESGKRPVQPRGTEANAEHTPGPWMAHDEPVTLMGNPDVDVSAGGTIPVATVYAARASSDFAATITANTRLIAAAPDLLGALRRLEQRHRPLPEGHASEDHRIIQAAIAKATGESQTPE